VLKPFCVVELLSSFLQEIHYFADIPNLHTWDNGKTWNTGGFNRNQLSSIYNLIISELSPKPSIIETGAGNSTITFLLTAPE
jgi:hypothetical protein